MQTLRTFTRDAWVQRIKKVFRCIERYRRVSEGPEGPQTSEGSAELGGSQPRVHVPVARQGA